MLVIFKECHCFLEQRKIDINIICLEKDHNDDLDLGLGIMFCSSVKVQTGSRSTISLLSRRIFT